MATCSICFSSLKSGQINATECGHVFHNICLHNWYQTNQNHFTCPSCRSIIDWASLRRLHLDFSEDSIQNNSMVEDIHQYAFRLSAEITEMKMKLISVEKKNETLLKTKEVYRERVVKLRQENIALKATEKNLKTILTKESNQRKFYEHECLALTAQIDELQNNW